MAGYFQGKTASEDKVGLLSMKDGFSRVVEPAAPGNLKAADILRCFAGMCITAPFHLFTYLLQTFSSFAHPT